MNAARSSVPREASIALAIAALLVVFVVVLGVLQRPTSPAASAPPLFTIEAPTISGNATSGWTFGMLIYVPVAAISERLPWRNMTLRLVNVTDGGLNGTDGGLETPYSIPEGTTLRVFAPSGNLSAPYGPMVADYNLTNASWRSGGSTSIQDGQWLVLQGMIPAGHYALAGTNRTYSGPVLTCTLDNGAGRGYVPLGVQ